jgi:hypothetical protein
MSEGVNCKLQIENCKLQIENPGGRPAGDNLQFAFCNLQFAILIAGIGAIDFPVDQDILLAGENDRNPKRKRGRKSFPRLRFGLRWNRTVSPAGGIHSARLHPVEALCHE